MLVLFMLVLMLMLMMMLLLLFILVMLMSASNLSSAPRTGGLLRIYAVLRGKHQSAVFTAHGSPHRYIPTYTTLPRFAPPRVPAPALLGEYHYHRPVVFSRLIRDLAVSEGALAPRLRPSLAEPGDRRARQGSYSTLTFCSPSASQNTPLKPVVFSSQMDNKN